MIEIPKEELLESLKLGYLEYVEYVDTGRDEMDLGTVKGYCTTIEQILSAYGQVTKEEILEIKKPILGHISLQRKTKNNFSNNLDDLLIDKEKSKNENTFARYINIVISKLSSMF